MKYEIRFKTGTEATLYRDEPFDFEAMTKSSAWVFDQPNGFRLWINPEHVIYVKESEEVSK